MHISARISSRFLQVPISRLYIGLGPGIYTMRSCISICLPSCATSTYLEWFHCWLSYITLYAIYSSMLTEKIRKVGKRDLSVWQKENEGVYKGSAGTSERRKGKVHKENLHSEQIPA